MKILSPKHALEEWVSTIFGVLILLLAVVYLFVQIYNNTLTTKEVIVLAALGAVGIIFVFVKINFILKFLPGSGGKDSPDTPGTTTT